MLLGERRSRYSQICSKMYRILSTVSQRNHIDPTTVSFVLKSLLQFPADSVGGLSTYTAFPNDAG